MPTLRTWAGRSSFSYTGSVRDGTEVRYGNGHRTVVTAEHYAHLLRHFAGRTVNIGSSRCGPPGGTLGEWVNEHIVARSLVSYLGPILVAEGHAQKAGGALIRFR
jgi:hypothetical protein